jgi:hypothetical protein
MTFHVGQKVVCISNTRAGGYGWEILPDIGAVYTIRSIEYRDRGGWLRLVEIVNRSALYMGYGYSEGQFHASNFRPAVTRKTDISIFTKMLIPDKVGV